MPPDDNVVDTQRVDSREAADNVDAFKKRFYKTEQSEEVRRSAQHAALRCRALRSLRCDAQRFERYKRLVDWQRRNDDDLTTRKQPSLANRRGRRQEARRRQRRRDAANRRVAADDVQHGIADFEARNPAEVVAVDSSRCDTLGKCNRLS